MINLRQRGELALTLSLFGLFISLIGIGLGTQMSQNVQQSTSQAQTGLYPYRSVLEIRDENNQVIKWIPGLIWATTYDEKIAGRNNGNIKDKDGYAITEWDTEYVPPALQGTKAQISIGLPAGYRVLSSFCTSIPTSICDNMKVEPDGLTYSRISVEKNGYLQYAIRIASGTAPTPTLAPTTLPTAQPTAVPTSRPTSVPTSAPTITATPIPTVTLAPTSNPTPTVMPTVTPPACQLKEFTCKPIISIIRPLTDSVEITWELPTCAGYKKGDQFWVDIIRNAQSSSERDTTVCVAESSTNSVICRLGKELPNRILNKDTSEFKNKTWENHRDYTVRVFTVQPAKACLSEPAEGTFIHDVPDPKKPTITPTPTPEPTSIPEGCSHLRGNGKYRIAIAGQGYSDTFTLQQLAQRAISVIQQTNLSDEGLFDTLSFVLYDKLDHDMKCQRNTTVPRLLVCDYSEEFAIRSTCGAQTLITIVNDQEWGGSGRDRSAVVTEGTISAVGHELGHAVPLLADEYVYTNEGNNTPHGLNPGDYGYNCTVESDTSCRKWTNPGQCVVGCQFEKSRRQLEESIMKGGTNDYPPAGLESWRFVLNASQKFTLAGDGEAEYHQSLVVKLQQNKLDDLELTSLDVQKIYPSRVNSPQSDYYVEMQNSDGVLLYNDTVAGRQYILHEYQGPGDILPTLSLYLPVINGASKLIISNSNKVPVLTIDISSNMKSVTSTAQNLCGNSYCDAQIGETAQSCRADCGNQLATSQWEKSDLDKNHFVNTLDLIMMYDAYASSQQPTIDSSADAAGVNTDIDGDAKTNAIDLSVMQKWLGTSY